MRNNEKLYRVSNYNSLRKRETNTHNLNTSILITEEQKVKALLEKYLGAHVKKQAELERKRPSLPIKELSEEEDQQYDSDDIPQKTPVLSRQKAYIQERKKMKQPRQPCLFL